MNNLPDLLTASSILLGIITALFGLFYPDIRSVIEIKPKTHAVDNTENYDKSRMIFRTKYLPLLIGSFVVSLINVPELYKVLKTSFITIINNGINNITYDTVIATYIVVCLFLIFFTVIMIPSGFKMISKVRKLNPNSR